MWTESLLFHTLPQPVGRFLENYAMPFAGECTSKLPPLLNVFTAIMPV